MTDNDKLALIGKMISEYAEYYGEHTGAVEMLVGMIEVIIAFGGGSK